MKSRSPIFALALACLALAASAASASANDLFTIDPDPESPGHLIEDAAGNAYVAWTKNEPGSGPDATKFCKIPPGGTCTPITLPITGATSLSEGPSAAIPVFGAGSAVYVVSPRYALNDVVFWTSIDAGASFGFSVERNFYSSKTNPTDVFLVGSDFLVGAYNAGLGFSTTGVAAAVGGSLSFADPGDGGVAGSSMALAGGTAPVIAYWNISDPPYPLLFYRYKGAGSTTLEGNWEGPKEVTKGYEPSLVNGPAGLFMASMDYSGGPYPNAINVRRLEGANFGPPKTLAVDPTTNLFIGGAIAQSPSGNRLAVAWPGKRSADGASVMRLFTSTDGGNSYAESHISNIGDAPSIGPNAELATNDAGVGWLTYTDSTGLRLADLNPVAGPKIVEKVPPNYKGKTKEITKKAGPFFIVLRLPKNCVQSRQRFFMGVGKRKRKQLIKKLGGGTLRFTKVVFIYDGKKLKVKKKKPFRYLVDPGPLAPSSVHRAKAKVTAVLTQGEREKKIKRVIKGTIRAC